MTNRSCFRTDAACVEGTIVNLYVKKYDYDVHYDKFDEDDIMHMQISTVVYEIAVDKTWYGEDVSGQTITVEDTDDFDSEKGQGGYHVRSGREYVDYHDKMYLVDQDSFTSQMPVLVSNIE